VKPKLFYLALCILRAVLPYWQFIPWLAEHGVNGRLFAQGLFATRISTFFALDVIVSAVAVLRFIRRNRDAFGSTTPGSPFLPLCCSAFRCACRYFSIFVNFNWNGRAGAEAAS